MGAGAAADLTRELKCVLLTEGVVRFTGGGAGREGAVSASRLHARSRVSAPYTAGGQAGPS